MIWSLVLQFVLAHRWDIIEAALISALTAVATALLANWRQRVVDRRSTPVVSAPSDGADR